MTIEGPAFDVVLRRTEAGLTMEVRGDMDIASVESLDQALDQALAQAPARVTVDLRAVGFVDSSGLKFLLRANTVARRDGWDLQFYRPAETAIRALTITGVIDLLPFVDAGPPPRDAFDDHEAATLSEAEKTLRLEIPSTLLAPRTARMAIRDLVSDHPLASPQLDKLTLLVSEIVTNAVTHTELAGDGEVEFSVTITPELTRVLVSDSGHGFEWPAESLPPGRVDGGYGIMLLDGQSSRWGVHRVPGRFTVWFEVDHMPAQSDALARADAIAR
jgi:anti-sigma B factor antagonist